MLRRSPDGALAEIAFDSGKGLPAYQRLADAIVYLFAEAEHDAARLGMLMSLREFVGLGHNLGGKQADDSFDWEEEVHAALKTLGPTPARHTSYGVLDDPEATEHDRRL